MFKIESYVTPILLSYVDKYVRDFKPADAQVSLWGGGVVLHNLVLKADVLQQEVSLPFTLVSGRIHELLIQVPWTKIMSEPIIVNIDTIECVLSLRPPSPSEGALQSESQNRTQVVEAPPGYMQALVRRIVSNIALRIHHLIVKYVEDDIVLSLNVKHVAIDSAGLNWAPTFADIDPTDPVLRRIIRLDDLTLCLDNTDTDGKIRFYQEPLLYRCQLTFRVLTRLVSATTRRAISQHIQLQSSKLAFGVTNEQLLLLLRLIQESPRGDLDKVVRTPSMTDATAPPTPLHASSNTGEHSAESWTEWAWSWLPTWKDKDIGTEETQAPMPNLFQFVALIDSISLVFKLMETDNGGKKRPRGVLEFTAKHATLRGSLCSPIFYQVSLGARNLYLQSTGKCACGQFDTKLKLDTIDYINKIGSSNEEPVWEWPMQDIDNITFITREEDYEQVKSNVTVNEAELPGTGNSVDTEEQKYESSFWNKILPVVYMSLTHERSPPTALTNPFENPPTDFEYSDWVEQFSLNVLVEPMELIVTTGLIHRISTITRIFQQLPPSPPAEVITMPTLTVEECEALLDNLPQRHVKFEWQGMRVRIVPWEHGTVAQTQSPSLYLDLEAPRITAIVTAPMYPNRVCKAACQMPQDDGPLWQGARVHVTAALDSVQVSLSPVTPDSDRGPRPVARADLRVVIHRLLNHEYFLNRDSVIFSCSLKLREANVCGSTARMMATRYILLAMLQDKAIKMLQYSSLWRDALYDEEVVAIDVTLEDLSIRVHTTRNIYAINVIMQAARATALYAPLDDELKQAWLFSGPDTSTTVPYLRVAIQWCEQPMPNAIDYIGIWMEPTALCFDPLLITWLAYKPQLIRPMSESNLHLPKTSSSTSTAYLRRRSTPPSSSGRGGSKAASELVHMTRPKSLASSSEPSDHKVTKSNVNIVTPEPWWQGDKFVTLHSRMKHLLISIDLGLTLLYISQTTASAVDCVTVRDAIEIHAAAGYSVLAISLGRLSLQSNALMKQLWQEVRHDGPTIFTSKLKIKNEDCFPWKMHLTDVSCYTLELKTSPHPSLTKLHSQIKIPYVVAPVSVLELLNTTITISIVTKSLAMRNTKSEQRKHETETEERIKYFTAGNDFRPSTLREFVRGPSRRQGKTTEVKAPVTPQVEPIAGPVVALGLCIHADTPPIKLKLDEDQLQVVSSAIHCIQHLTTLINKKKTTNPSQYAFYSQSVSRRVLARSVSEMHQYQMPSEESLSDNKSEMLIIYESNVMTKENKIKISFWFQWVVCRISLVLANDFVKIACNIEDIISTVDLQAHYNQLKIKVTSASVRHYERTEDDEWNCGAFDGRVLEAVEPVNASDETHFLAVTVTQANISSLPASWKEELNPKMLESKENSDTMWEIYATMAPLEAVIWPTLLTHTMLLIEKIIPTWYCPLDNEKSTRISTRQWPFCYVTAGGIRLIIKSDEQTPANDDTLIIKVGKISVSPHPENPICRRTTMHNVDGGWTTAGNGLDGRQYEIIIKIITIHSTKFIQLIHQELNEKELQNGIGGENPALKWTQPLVSPVLTTILHPLVFGCVLAPALYVSDGLASGPAVELNFMSDCSIDITAMQLKLFSNLVTEILRKMNLSMYSLNDEYETCPYLNVLKNYRYTTIEDAHKIQSEDEITKGTLGRTVPGDSGVDSASTAPSTSKSTKYFNDVLPKKSLSVVFDNDVSDSIEYLELYVTVGVVELSLYTLDDDTEIMDLLRPPTEIKPILTKTRSQSIRIESSTNVTNSDSQRRLSLIKEPSLSMKSGTRRESVYVKENPLIKPTQPTIKNDLKIHLLHITLHQPNLYYWKRRLNKGLQMSLFNACIALGSRQTEGLWRDVLFSTTRGKADPVTDIPPALATMKVDTTIGGAYSSCTAGGGRGTVKLNIDRPVLIEVSMDRINRLKAIATLIKSQIKMNIPNIKYKIDRPPLLYDLRLYMVKNWIENITVNTTQIGLSGSEGAVGWEHLSFQINASGRPERLTARGLVTAIQMSVGPPGDLRYPLLHPFMFGMECEGSWEAWRRAEGGPSAQEPMMRLNLDVDHVTIDVRPQDLAALTSITNVLESLLNVDEAESKTIPLQSVQSSIHSKEPLGTNISQSLSDTMGEHYYKDDLRSGAFKILEGSQLPMAYQVLLNEDTVSWKYPHPRTITRIVVYPLPDQPMELDCVLEHYDAMLNMWLSLIYFKLPVEESREIIVNAEPPNAVFVPMWRFRLCHQQTDSEMPYTFNIKRFTTTAETYNEAPGVDCDKKTYSVSAKQLSGILRVDSYIAPRLLPLMRLTLRVTSLSLHIRNSLPTITPSQKIILEGYYVSKPLMRRHRVISVTARHTFLHAHLASLAGSLLLLNTNLSSSIVDNDTGTIEELMEESRVQAAFSIPDNMLENSKCQFRTGTFHIKLQIQRLYTLQALMKDWTSALQQLRQTSNVDEIRSSTPELVLKKYEDDDITSALQGRVTMWIHNDTALALRVGQENTDEVVPLGSGVKLAYRWRYPNSPFRVKFSLAGPSTEYQWSKSIAFNVGEDRLKLEGADILGGCSKAPGAGVYLHTRVVNTGAKQCLHLSGRLYLANLMRFNLLYKVRTRNEESDTWRTIFSSEMHAEAIAKSVICGVDTDLVLKIKLANHDVGWSGDIPIKECPKDNVPWLVKVPSEGNMPYVSVWCRVVRATSDGRILVTIWPLYILESQLPLDADVFIKSDTGYINSDDETASRPPVLIQSAPGRGTRTHLILPGTTTATHTLTFQYRNIESPVTRDSVPLHYGVTNASVFDKRPIVNNIEEVIRDIQKWLKTNTRHSESEWPYSCVVKHRLEPWKPALLQPRCDVIVKYQAIQAGGGCCLEMQLCPVVLLCNASPLALTLRAYDAAPLCKVEAGNAIAPPSIILKNKFYVSVEIGRDTYVSGELEIYRDEVGHYASPPPGAVALDHPTPFAVQCNQKVALLTLYYELKEDTNVLGISSTYVVINQLSTNIMVATTAVPCSDTKVLIRPKSYKTIPPIDNSRSDVIGSSLVNFWVYGSWRGGNACDLQKYIFFILETEYYSHHSPMPVCLEAGPVRRSVALRNQRSSIAAVVTQQRFEGRWLITIAEDPCPQYVIHNYTRTNLAIGQPIYNTSDEPSTSKTGVEVECIGTRWHCHVEQDCTSYYTTPSYCARYPPSPNATQSDDLPFVTFAIYREAALNWCSPVPIATGEQLVQVTGDVTIKLRVQQYPHSTLLELQDVNQNDISASDIRRRLLSNESSQMLIKKKTPYFEQHKFDRIHSNAEVFANENETNSDNLRNVQIEVSASPLIVNSLTYEHGVDANAVADILVRGKLTDETIDKISTKSEATNQSGLSAITVARPDYSSSLMSDSFISSDWDVQGVSEGWVTKERVKGLFEGLVIVMATSSEVEPLVVAHIDNLNLQLLTDIKGITSMLSIGALQIDNHQYESGQYDFAVVASTTTAPRTVQPWPSLWNMFGEIEANVEGKTHLMVRLRHDKWTVENLSYQELTEVELRMGQLALYIEDAYVSALVELFRMIIPATVPSDSSSQILIETQSLQHPLRLRSLHIHPLDLTLTLHTAVRMYIALDQSPLRLSAFELQDMMISTESLTHALTVHYLSAAILGAGWVVGGLELLGAPGALAARVGGASGGVRAVASATAAAILRSFSAWAGSLARNLDLLAGDDEHTRRAAAARRKPPPSLLAGLSAGFSNFAINILGAVGGLAHHSLVGVAVGESDSGTVALRRSILGAVTKPLSATADLVAFAGHGLLRQTGWDPVLQPRTLIVKQLDLRPSWARDCVRWCFRLAELSAIAGYEVLLNDAPLLLLLSHKYFIIADPETERIVETIDFRNCTLSPYEGPIILVTVMQRRQSRPENRVVDANDDEDEDFEVNAAAMARVARYTGADGGMAGGAGGTEPHRVITLLPPSGRDHALYAILVALIHHNNGTHFQLM